MFFCIYFLNSVYVQIYVNYFAFCFCLLCFKDREILQSHFHTLKREMVSCRELERSNLTTLTLQSDAAIKELQRKKDRVSLPFWYLFFMYHIPHPFLGSTSLEGGRDVPEAGNRGRKSSAFLRFFTVPRRGGSSSRNNYTFI